MYIMKYSCSNTTVLRLSCLSFAEYVVHAGTMQIQWLHLSNQKPSSADHMEFSWACLYSPAPCLSCLAIARLDSPHLLCYLEYRIVLQTANKTVVDTDLSSAKSANAERVQQSPAIQSNFAH